MSGDELSLPLEELGVVLSAPGRLRILDELLGGTPLPAGALAARLRLAPSTVSSHLSRLVDAGLISVEQAGRTRLARLANEGVADTVEALLRLSAESPVSSLRGDRRRTPSSRWKCNGVWLVLRIAGGRPRLGCARRGLCGVGC